MMDMVTTKIMNLPGDCKLQNRYKVQAVGSVIGIKLKLITLISNYIMLLTW